MLYHASTEYCAYSPFLNVELQLDSSLLYCTILLQLLEEEHGLCLFKIGICSHIEVKT